MCGCTTERNSAVDEPISRTRLPGGSRISSISRRIHCASSLNMRAQGYPGPQSRLGTLAAMTAHATKLALMLESRRFAGSEKFVCDLLSQLDRDRYRPVVVVNDNDDLVRRLRAAAPDSEVIPLNLATHDGAAVIRVARAVRERARSARDAAPAATAAAANGTPSS